MKDYGLRDRLTAYMISLKGGMATAQTIANAIKGNENSVKTAISDLMKMGKMSHPKHHYYKWVDKPVTHVETPKDTMGALKVTMEHHPELRSYFAHFLLGAKMPKDIMTEMHNHVKHTEGQKGFTSDDPWAYLEN